MLQFDSLERGCLFEVGINPLLWCMIFIIKVPLLWPEVTSLPADPGFLGHAWWV